MVVAAVAPQRVDGLRALLAQMNTAPGQVDALNRLLPFGRFDTLHFARFVIVDDVTQADGGGGDAALPIYLAFFGDCDGPAHRLLDAFVVQAEDGLRRIFAHCTDFSADVDLLRWLRAHDVPVAARYVNWLGRSVRQVREEQALAQALAACLKTLAPADAASPPAARARLVEFAANERRGGRLPLGAAPSTPWGWRWRNLLHVVGVPVVGLLLLPFVLVLSPLIVWQLRLRETRDPEIAPPPSVSHVQSLAVTEDRDVTTAFSAVGSSKPGGFRAVLLWVLLVLLDYASRHVFDRGHLTRVQTIHFARWVYLDDRRRLLFASNYDGSLEAYMDDFINKVAWGLNLVFSNGVGYPRTDWLVQGGARDAQVFKRYLRRHQLPNAVWYKAYPGLTAQDLMRHTRIREGLERSAMSDAEIVEWLRLI